MDSMKNSLLGTGLMLVALLVVSGPGLSQSMQQNWTLIVSGQPGQAPVLRVNGRSYVNTEALARLTSGSLTFNGNQITLTLPSSGTDAPAAAPPASQAAASGFSKDFMKAG